MFDESFSSDLAYASQHYSEAMTIHPAVTYTPCATSLREQTGDIITFTQFEEGGIWTKTRNYADSDDDDSIMPPLLWEEDIDVMDSGDESDRDIISMDILEDICDGSQSHPNVNWRDPVIKNVIVFQLGS